MKKMRDGKSIYKVDVNEIILKMKLLTLMIFIAFVSASASSYSQATKFNLDMKNVTIGEVFQKIEEQSEFVILFNEKTLDINRKVDVIVKDKTVENILDQIFKGDKDAYRIFDKQIAIYPNDIKELPSIANTETSVEQKKEITGIVRDSKGLSLPGVTVAVKGTTQGTITDSDGKYTFTNLPVDAVLVFSFVGLKTQEISVNGKANINVVMVEATVGMDEVVVVGYGTQIKSNLTGAIEQINARDIASQSGPSIATSLQGLLPGLNIQSNNGNPGENPDINIRGFNSINGGGPLILVDGILGNIERINPSDIESVTVLKDAASSAIYGARGAFGVILITTKQGKEGEMVVNYSNNFGVTSPTTRTDYISDPYLYGKTIDAAIYGYNGTSYTGYNEADWEIIKKVSKGETAPYRELQSNGTYKFYDKTDWYSYLFRKLQPTENHSISISGGNKKIQGYLSGRYYKTSTIQNIVDAPLTKYNLKATINFQATDWLAISDNIQYNTSDQIEYGGYKTGFGGIWSTTTWYNLFAFQPNKIDGVSYDFAGGGAHAALEDKSNWMRYNSEQLINTISAKLTPLRGLLINFDYSNRINHIANSTRLNTFSFYTGSKVLLNNSGVNRLTESRNRNYYNSMNAFGTYTKNLADKHHFKLMLGYNQEYYDEDNILAEQGGLLINDLSNLNLGTEVLRADGSSSLWTVQGYYGRLNYDYKNKYLLEVNSRYDGSSRFPNESRWGLFPSVSGGWYLSRETFWKPLDNVISSFKLRTSYGKLGNQNIGLYTFSQILGIGQSAWLVNGTKLNYASIPSPLPSAVSWESTKTIDFGADMSFMKGKLTASFDWYEKGTSEMYLPGEPLPAVFGAAEPKENIASLRNRGFELSVGYNNQFELAGHPLRVRASASVFNFNAVITKYPNPNGVMSTYWEGQKLGQIWGYHIDGQFQSDEEAKAYQDRFTNPSSSLGKVYKYEINTVQNTEWKGLRAGDVKYIDFNGDGKIDKGDYTLANHGDLQPMGNAMPQYPFGFNFGLDWNGIDISIAGAGVAHQDWYPTGDIYWGSYERPYLSFIRKDLLDNAWTPEQPGNTYPQIYRGYASLGAERSLGEVNDYYLTNVGYLRMKNLTIGYTLPKSLTQKIKIKTLRVYVSGENIFTWRFGNLTKYIDPEQAGSGINYNNPDNADDRARMEDYPIGKTISTGINITL